MRMEPERWQNVREESPCLANRLLKRVRDFAQVKYDGKITKEVADFALELLEVDRYGLDQYSSRKIWRRSFTNLTVL